MFDSRTSRASLVRNFVFGVEDSLVSTVGLLAGVAMGGVSRNEIILTGFVLISVEAFSMGMGSLLSEHSAEEYIERRDVPFRGSIAGAAVMLVSYFIAGFVPLLPYVLLAGKIAVGTSVLASFVALFILGVFSARLFGVRIIRGGLEMLVLGGTATLIGVLVGILFT